MFSSYVTFYLRVRTCAMAFQSKLDALPDEWREKLTSIGFDRPMVLANLKPAQLEAFLPNRPLEVERLIGLAKALEHGDKVKSSVLPPPKLFLLFLYRNQRCLRSLPRYSVSRCSCLPRIQRSLQGQAVPPTQMTLQ